ncbi:hypothetical protein DFH08DRAFT_946692 [Mycena albidolilacea]|uniref:Uncharacterized protein n=1 Tax=Mycena albidolilacea TaxID=1033008 RepID=A0AAD7ATB2_9AGAR|nr:hypothetical protein DFH08DRAFT_946692 [Mycena albidolilacea]
MSTAMPSKPDKSAHFSAQESSLTVMICLMSRVGATNPPIAMASPLGLGRPAIYTEPFRSNVRTKSDFPTSARVVLYSTRSKTTPKPNPKTSTQGRCPFVVGHVPASRSSGSLFGPHVSPTADTLNRPTRVRAGPAQSVLRDADRDRNNNIHSWCSLPSTAYLKVMSQLGSAIKKKRHLHVTDVFNHPYFHPGAPTTTRPPTEVLPTPSPSPALLRHHPQQEMKENLPVPAPSHTLLRPRHQQEKEDTEESPIKEPCGALALRSVRLPEPFVFALDSSSSDESGSPPPTHRRQRKSPFWSPPGLCPIPIRTPRPYWPPPTFSKHGVGSSVTRTRR